MPVSTLQTLVRKTPRQRTSPSSMKYETKTQTTEASGFGQEASQWAPMSDLRHKGRATLVAADRLLPLEATWLWGGRLARIQHPKAHGGMILHSLHKIAGWPFMKAWTKQHAPSLLGETMLPHYFGFRLGFGGFPNRRPGLQLLSPRQALPRRGTRRCTGQVGKEACLGFRVSTGPCAKSATQLLEVSFQLLLQTINFMGFRVSLGEMEVGDAALA